MMEITEDDGNSKKYPGTGKIPCAGTGIAPGADWLVFSTARSIAMDISSSDDKIINNIYENLRFA